MTGKVKFWNRDGWGIITPNGVRRGDRKREVFIHADKLPDGVLELPEEAEVEFELFPGTEKQDPKAISVRLLGRLSYVPINEAPRKAAAHGD